MGIDPGSVVTGYGVIETDGIRSFHLANGHLRLAGGSFVERLGDVHRRLAALLDEWQPAEVAVEEVFISNNAMSALKLGQARGAVITAVVARDIPVSEYAARQVKQVVTGTGGAAKSQVQRMICSHLAIAEPLQSDAADGLAVALCHAHSRTANRLAAAAGSGARVGRRRGGRGSGRGLRR